MRNQVAMRLPIGSVSSRIALRLSAVGVLALGLGACSSETMRFGEAPFSNPFKTAQASGPAAVRDPATTGSIGKAASAPIAATPAPAVASVRSQPLPAPQSAVALRSAAPIPTGGSASGWSAQGGTPVVVAQGESLDMISSRYGVPKAALISSNGLSGPNVQPGQRITIPVYNAAGASAPARQTAQSTQVQSDSQPEPSRTVAAPASNHTLAPPSPPARVAAAPVAPKAPAQPAAVDKAKAASDAKVQAAADAKAKAAADAQAMRDSRAKFAAEAKAKAEAKKSASTLQPAAVPVAKPVIAEAKKLQPAPEKPVAVASAPPAQKAIAIQKPAQAAEPVVDPKTTASLPKAAPQPAPQAAPAPAAEESAADKADFRWPARGRVIQGFSGKGGNEGINIAVPEGTPVKAAEGGTVAYAGNELKGYGNLVLIRHPNGYVSAYAHNGALNVKRGDTIKRGQVVATAGQTGNVSSPQLHFELRKGSTPVDPTPYLNN
jgi:murein DD-endopeptidase MepM/ murein hydrolase activator NlpD